MTPFHLSHEFSGTPEAFWAVYFHRDYLDALRGITRTRVEEELSVDVTADRVVRCMRRQPERNVPGFVRRLMGGDLTFYERCELDRAAGSMTYRLSRTETGRPLMLGVCETAITGPRRFRRTFEGSIEVDIPLVGRRVERAVLEDLHRVYDRTYSITQAWLDGAMPSDGARL